MFGSPAADAKVCRARRNPVAKALRIVIMLGGLPSRAGDMAESDGRGSSGEVRTLPSGGGARADPGFPRRSTKRNTHSVARVRGLPGPAAVARCNDQRQPPGTPTDNNFYVSSPISVTLSLLEEAEVLWSSPPHGTAGIGKEHSSALALVVPDFTLATP